MFISPVFHTVVDVCDYTYTVTLLTEPTGDVTVTIHDPTDNTDVTTDPAALTFTPDNWDEEQYVTVTCTADDDDVVDRAYVSHTVRGGGYGGFNAPDVYITVYDTDIAGVYPLGIFPGNWRRRHRHLHSPAGHRAYGRRDRDHPRSY